MLANNLHIVIYWLLYCFPVCLQFITLCLLVLFFAQVVFKAKAKYEPSRYKRPLRIVLAAVTLIFLTTNISCAVLVKTQEKTHHSVPVYLLVVRVCINDTLFLLAAIVLAVCIYKMRKMTSSHVILEAKGTTVCQALTVSILTILLFASRAIYNLLVICRPLQKYLPTFNYGWINVSDQAEMVDLQSGYAYVSFGIVLFIWEVLPTFVIVMFFRVRKPVTGSTLTDLSSHNQSSRSYFFDNPRRYDSDDDLTRNDSQRIITDLNRSYQSINNVPSQCSTPRGTPRGTPKLYGSMYTASGSFSAHGSPQVN
ncbi:hypothetical protein FSP39_011777 [Pinctada imbricata]|uniref:Integral membrane protein GPR137B n=1 Tax=Pinctada imbricata TaxID=66713 RepID=A0AA89BRT1_PINIB|nr:hypothetical protein FSP39_011777 [Pinctada imbricata]